MISRRKQIADLLAAAPNKSGAGRRIDQFLILLILLNIVAIILESVEQLSVLYSGWFWGIEVFSVAVFTVEYVLRLWTCVELPNIRYQSAIKGRFRWAVSPLGIIDLLAILPFYVQWLLVAQGGGSWLLLRAMRGLRLLRIFKLTRFSPALQILQKVLKQEAPTLAVAGFVLFVVMILASWGIYALEKDLQPDKFPHIPAAMWWTVVTLTTVGYGDVVPVTVGGKVFAGLISLIGIGMLALPAGILASGFSTEIRRRDETYSSALEVALANGRITVNEARELDYLRERLGISAGQAKDLLNKAELERNYQAGGICPHCSEPLNNRKPQTTPKAES